MPAPPAALYDPAQSEGADPRIGPGLPGVAEELAQIVAVSGEELEDAARERNKDTRGELGFLHDKYSALYRNYRARVIEIKKGVDSQTQEDSLQSVSIIEPKRKRKSRWGNKDKAAPEVGVSTPSSLGAPGVALPTALGSPASLATRTALTPARAANPSLLAYAQRVFGSVDLDEAQWRQCEDQLKASIVYYNSTLNLSL